MINLDQHVSNITGKIISFSETKESKTLEKRSLLYKIREKPHTLKHPVKQAICKQMWECRCSTTYRKENKKGKY